MVSFGTSGHRGFVTYAARSPKPHILAITQAICEYRQIAIHHRAAVHGQRCYARPFRLAQRSEPLWKFSRPMGSTPFIQLDDGVTPTPVISRAILVYKLRPQNFPADGIVIATPSHNPPEDGELQIPTPPTAALPRHRCNCEWSSRSQRVMKLLRRPATRDQKRIHFRRRTQSGDDASRRLHPCPTSMTCIKRVDMDAIRTAWASSLASVIRVGGAALPYWEPKSIPSTRSISPIP